MGNTRQHCRSLWFLVTWNPTLFPDNATTTVELTYITADQQVAWYSPDVANVRGYVNVYMDKDWLLEASGNDTSLGMYIYGANDSYLIHFLGQKKWSGTKGLLIFPGYYRSSLCL